MKRTNQPQDTVIILAAGLGERMKPFDFVPKQLLPYKDKAIISHIIEQYPKHAHFIVVVNKEDKSTLEYLTLAHEGMHISVMTVINPHPGNPLHDLLVALKAVNNTSHVFVTVADGVYTLPRFTDQKNWLATYSVSVDAQSYYTNLSRGTAFKQNMLRHATEKVPVQNSVAWTGVLYVSSRRWLETAVADALERNANATFSDVFNIMNSVLEVFLIDMPEWVDLGTAHKYRVSRPKLDWSKNKQITYFVGNKVIKFFGAALQAKDFFDKSAIMPLPSRRPKVTKAGRFVSYNYVEGENAYTGMSSSQFLAFLDLMFYAFWKPKHEEEVLEPEKIERLRLWPADKVIHREADYLASEPDEHYRTVNGVEITETWVDVVRDIVNASAPTILAPIHGDLTLDNLVVTPSGVVTMLDWRPRAYESLKAVGDVYYDLGKLWLSLLIDLSAMKEGHFHMRAHEDALEIAMPCNSRLEYLQDLFMHWCAMRGFDMHTIEAQTVMQLGSMAGVHHAPFSTAFYWYGLYLAHKTA